VNTYSCLLTAVQAWVWLMSYPCRTKIQRAVGRRNTDLFPTATSPRTTSPLCVMSRFNGHSCVSRAGTLKPETIKPLPWFSRVQKRADVVVQALLCHRIQLGSYISQSRNQTFATQYALAVSREQIDVSERGKQSTR
jgi:hypothetical protein